MPKSIKCPNCSGPVVPNTEAPTVKCVYCGHHYKNPLYRSPQTAQTTAPQTPTKPSKLFWLVFILPGILFAIGISISVIVSSMAPRPPATVAPSVPVLGSSNSVLDPMEEKLNLYIDCLDRAYPRAKQSMERYLSWMKKPQKGPSCKERYIHWGLYEMYDDAPGDCEESVASANAAAPSLPQLHQWALQFVAAVKKTQPIFKEAADYYDKKLYQVDDCARGKALHPQLMASFGELTAANRNFRQLIAHYASGALDRCLKRTAADPKMIGGHNWANVVKVTGELVEAFRAEVPKKKPNTEVIKRHIAALNQAASALEALSDQQKEAAGYDWTDRGAIDRFIEKSVVFLSVKHRKIDQTFEELVTLYNGVLSSYRNMKFCGELLTCDGIDCPKR